MRHGALTAVLMAGMAFAQQEKAAIPGDSPAAADSARQQARNPTAAMLRSLVFPGWGQWYNGKRLKALLAFGAEAGLIANTIYQNQKVQSSTTRLERDYYLENRRLSNWWLAGVALYSMIDAYVDAHLSDFDESPDLSALSTPAAGRASSEEAPIWIWRVQFAL